MAPLTSATWEDGLLVDHSVHLRPSPALPAPWLFPAIALICLSSLLRLLMSPFIAILIYTNHLYRQCCEYEKSNSSVPTFPWWSMVSLCKAWESLVNLCLPSLAGDWRDYGWWEALNFNQCIVRQVYGQFENLVCLIHLFIFSDVRGKGHADQKCNEIMHN